MANAAKKPDAFATVVLSTYNGAPYLRKAIESVLAQTHAQLEFLIIDDGSNDQTVAIVRDLVHSDPRIKFTENKENRGTGYCYSTLIKSAQGQFISSIGQDDIWEPNFLAKSIAELTDNPQVSASFSKVRIINSHGDIHPSAKTPFQLELASKLQREDLFCELLNQNLLCSISAVFRRKWIENWRTLGDNDQLQDWETWLFLLLKGDFIFLDEVLASYRIHGSNLSLGGHSPIQSQIERAHVRATTLAGPEFAEFVLSRRDPDRFLYQVFTAIAEDFGPQSDAFLTVLLYALKSTEHRLGGLPTFRRIMGLLHLHSGSLHKSTRYLSHREDLSSCPPDFLRCFGWHSLVAIGGKQRRAPSTSTPILIERRWGVLRLIQVFTKKGALPRVGYCIPWKAARSTEKLIEKNLLLHSMDLKSKFSFILAWIRRKAKLWEAKATQSRIL